jgi:hypothetical protein
MRASSAVGTIRRTTAMRTASFWVEESLRTTWYGFRRSRPGIPK